MADCASSIAAAEVVGDPTPLLIHLAGEFAERIAGLWPAPHAEIVTAPAARRHLICLWLSFDRTGPGADLILDLPLRRILPTVIANSPPGLVGVLGRLGEVAWSGLDYRLLIDRMGEPATAKILRHSRLVTPGQVQRLSLLPPSMIAAGVGRLALDGDRAILLTEAFDAIRRNQGDTAATDAATRWGRIAGLKAVFDAALHDLNSEVPAPPFPGTQRLKPLASKADLRDAAARYHNCLRNMIPYASDGDYAYYEWLDAPGAALELNRDRLFGWRLSQARLDRNRTVPQSMRDEIIAELRGLGVHVGRSAWDIENALRRANRGDFRLQGTEAVIEELFTD